MSRKGEEKQTKIRCKECGRKVGIDANGKSVVHKCEKARREK